MCFGPYLSAWIGAIRETSAEKSASALREMVRGVAHVIREGMAQIIDVEQVVPGDLVLLNSGNKVPADMLLLTAQNLAVDESMLTGESLAVTKNAEALVADDAAMSDKFNRCFAGSIITHGRAQGMVITKGVSTLLPQHSELKGSVPSYLTLLKEVTGSSLAFF